MMSLPSLAVSSYSHHEALLPAAPASSSLQKVGKLMDSNDYFLTSIFSSSHDPSLNDNNNNQDAAGVVACSSKDEPEKSSSAPLPSPGCSQTSTASKLSFDTNISLATTDDSFVLAYSESDPEDVDNSVGVVENGQRSRSMLTYIPSQATDDYSACNDVITSVDQIHINLDLVTEVEVEDSSLLYELTTNHLDSIQTFDAPCLPLESNQTPEAPSPAVDSSSTAPSDSNQTLKISSDLTPQTPEASILPAGSSKAPNRSSLSDSVKSIDTSAPSGNSPDSISRNGVLPTTTTTTTTSSSGATSSPSVSSIASSFHRAGVRALSPRIHLVRTTPARSTTSSPCSANSSLSKTPRDLKQQVGPSSKLSSSKKYKSANRTDYDSLGHTPGLTHSVPTTCSKDIENSTSETVRLEESTSVSQGISDADKEVASSVTRPRSGKIASKPTTISKDDDSTTVTDAPSLIDSSAMDDDGMAQSITEYETTSRLRPRRGISTTNPPRSNAIARSSKTINTRKPDHIVTSNGQCDELMLGDQPGNIHITDEYQHMMTATAPNVTAMSVLGDIWSCSRITRSVKRKANELEDQLPKQLPVNPEPSKQKETSKARPIKSASAKKRRVLDASAATEQMDDIFELNSSVDELLRYSLVAYHLRRPSSSASYNVAELSRRTLLMSPYGEKKLAKNDVPSNSTGPVETEGKNKSKNASISQSSNASGGATPGRRSSARGTTRGKGKGVVNKPQKRRAGRRSNDSIVSLQNWTCCLCRQGSNVFELGELYGPYNESGASVEMSDKTDGEGTTSGEQELWVHAVCAIWAPGVCLVGAELKGLKEAIEEGSKMTCVVCKKTGAVMKCLNHSCKSPFHYPCAKTNGCSFNLDLFSITCSKHDSSKQSAL